MNGYVEKRFAYTRFDLSRYKLKSLIGRGAVRIKETKVLPHKRKIVFVNLSDIEEYLSGADLEYIEVKNVSRYGITQNAVRYQIHQGRLRWIRHGSRLYVCKKDFEAYLSDKGERGQAPTPCLAYA